MIASSTINNQKRRLSAAESKRKRIRREFTSNLSLLIPEDPLEEKENLNSEYNTSLPLAITKLIETSRKN